MSIHNKKIFNKNTFIKSVFFLMSLFIVICAPILAMSEKKDVSANKEMEVLDIWQIDGFEGGKGSRAAYLQNIGNNFSKELKCYINVKSLTADAARANLSDGVIPDLISYGAGMYGLENYLTGKNPYTTWCYGAYCFLSLDPNADFADITSENTIINSGKDNLAECAALFYGISDATADKSVGAYVKLINGEYKYLLGTQRDIFRLKTRGVAYTIEPVTQFNDLYQNISILTSDKKRRLLGERFINYLIEQSDNLSKIGLMKENYTLYEDEMHTMEGLNYDYKLISPISNDVKDKINTALKNKDIKTIKNLFN